ncbi:MAG: hypothetical protein ACLQGP_12970 [Isosphaeraceae bacterium]
MRVSPLTRLAAAINQSSPIARFRYRLLRMLTPIGSKRGYRRTRLINGRVLVLCALVAGCGHSDKLPALQVYEVKGKVLLADGKPLSSGWISFVPKGDLPVTPSAAIEPDGSFSIVTGGSGDGAPPGEYKVRVEAPQPLQPGQRHRGKPLFPSKYNDEDSSGLVIAVRAGSNQLTPIVLK